METEFLVFLIGAVVGCEWCYSRLIHFTPRESAPQ